MKKRLLIDGTTLSHQIDGLTRYALSIIKRLDFQTLDATILCCPEEEKWIQDQLQIRTIVADIAPIGPRRDTTFRRWLQLHQKEYDMLFEPSNQFPSGVKIPSVYVIHDVIYEEFPEQLGKYSSIKRAYLHHVVQRGLRNANRVICVSEFTKKNVLYHHGKKYREKIRVIGEGWEHLEDNSDSTQAIMPVGKYFFYLGSSRGHKNIHNLLLAIEKTAVLMREKGYKLLIAGRNDRYTGKDKLLLTKLNDVVETTGWVSDDVISHYFRKAEAFIFPSFSEGFGIPLLEAFYYGTPVLCSNTASLPEVAGDAALYFDPKDVDDMAKVLSRVMTDRINKDELIKNGKKRLMTYQWNTAASTITKEIEKLG